MKWFLDLTTRNKLFVGFGLMIASLAVVIATAYLGITTIQAAQQKLYQEEFTNGQELMKLRVEQNGVRASLLSMMLVTKPSDQEIWQQDVRERGKEIAALTQRLLERTRGDSGLFNKLEEFKKSSEAFAQTRDDQLIPLIHAGKMDQARELALGIQEERYSKMRAIAKELGNAAVEKARTAVADSELAAKQTVRLFVMVGVVAILLAVAMALLTSRIIAIPLQMISGIAGQVASGDLTGDVPQDNRADAVRALLRAFIPTV